MRVYNNNLYLRSIIFIMLLRYKSCNQLRVKIIGSFSLCTVTRNSKNFNLVCHTGLSVLFIFQPLIADILHTNHLPSCNSYYYHKLWFHTYHHLTTVECLHIAVNGKIPDPSNIMHVAVEPQSSSRTGSDTTGIVINLADTLNHPHTGL